MTRSNEAIEAHVWRIEDGPNCGDDSDVIAKDRKVMDVFTLRSHERQRSRGSGGFKPNRKEDDMPIWIFARDLQRICRRIYDADVGPASLVLKRAAMRSRNAHHVAEGCKARIVFPGDVEPIVDPTHRQHANRTPRTVDKLDVVRKDIFQTKAIDSVSVTAAHLHDAVVMSRFRKAANFFGSFGNQFGIAEFIDISHHASPEVTCLLSRLGFLSHCGIQPPLPDHSRELRPWQSRPPRAW